MVRDYIILAIGAMAVGVVIIFIMLGYVTRAGINLNENLWLLAVPAVLALAVNVLFLEIYRRWRKK